MIKNIIIKYGLYLLSAFPIMLTIGVIWSIRGAMPIDVFILFNIVTILISVGLSLGADTLFKNEFPYVFYPTRPVNSDDLNKLENELKTFTPRADENGDISLPKDNKSNCYDKELPFRSVEFEQSYNLLRNLILEISEDRSMKLI
ncbi:hypothetical protein, partial [Photobacterium angustum]